MYLKHYSCILLSVSLIFALSLHICFAQTFPFTGEVSSNAINVRSDSTTGSQVVCQVSKGVKLEVVSELYGWYKIRLPKSAPSYVKQALFECLNYEVNSLRTTSLHIEAGKRCLNAKAVAERINIRLSPSESSPILGKLSAGETVKIISTKGEWFAIEPVKDSYGWINMKFVRAVTEEKKENKWIKQGGR